MRPCLLRQEMLRHGGEGGDGVLDVCAGCGVGEVVQVWAVEEGAGLRLGDDGLGYRGVGRDGGEGGVVRCGGEVVFWRRRGVWWRFAGREAQAGLRRVACCVGGVVAGVAVGRGGAERCSGDGEWAAGVDCVEGDLEHH